MKRMPSLRVIAPVAILALAACAPSAHAQRASFFRLFRPYHQVALAQLDEVAKALTLTEEQQQKAVELYDTLNQDRGALLQEAGFDFESIREELSALSNDTAAKFNEALDESQRSRLQEIFVQSNGPAVLLDDATAAALEITEEQKTKLAEIRGEIIQEFRDSPIDWQSLSDEEAAAKVDELLASQDELYAAVMTDEQRTALEKLQGEKLEIDLGNLPSPFGG